MGQASDAPLPADEPRPQPAPREPATRRPRPQWGRTVARQAATVSAKLGPVVRGAGDRVAAASPTTLLLGVLAVLVIASIVAALAFRSSLGVAAIVLFIPTLSAAIGAVGMRCLDDRRKSQERNETAREETRALHQIEHTLDYVDTKLTTALTQFGTERHNEAVIGMFQAKAATELYLGTGSRPDRSSAPDSDDEGIDLVGRYGLAELLTPGSVGRRADSTAASDRSCA